MNKSAEQRINTLLNKYFNLFVLLLAVALFVLGYFIVIEPKYQQTKQSIQRRVNLQSQNYLAKKENLEKAKELVSVYNNTDNERIEKINTFLPTDPSHEQLFTALDDLVSRNGLILSEMNISIPSEEAEEEAGGVGKKEPEEQLIERDLPPYIEKAEVDVRLLGADYPSFKSFLISLERNLRLVDVVNIDFAPEKGSADLRLWVYFFDKEEFNIKRDINL